MGDDGERIEPWLLHHVRRLRRWQKGNVSHWACQHVTLGVLPDGRWLVDHSDVTVGARAYQDQDQAERAATELMWDGDWVEVPAAYDAAGKPIGGGWVRRGGSWRREQPSQDTPEQR